MSASIRAALGTLLGGECVVEPDAAPWQWGEGHADAVVFPRNTDGVVDVLRLASAEGWRVVPAGLGSWLDGAWEDVPQREVVVLSTREMRDIVDYEPADLTMVAQAGVTLAEIQATARVNGQWLPWNPPPDDGGTLGATLATASAGSLASLVGAPRDLTIGLHLVTGDGRRLRAGGRVVKNVAGFDLVRVSIGSRGRLGVLTEATVRLLPLPEVDRFSAIHGPDRAALEEAARAIATGPVQVAGLELLEPGLVGSSAASLLVRMLGSAREVDAMVDTLERTSGRTDWSDPMPRGGTQRDVARSWDRAIPVVLEVALLPSLLTRSCALVDRLRSSTSDGWGGRIRVATDALTGTSRVCLTPAPSTATPAIAEQLRQLRRSVEAEGGTVRLLRGSRSLRRHSIGEGRSEAEQAVVRAIVDAFDPVCTLGSQRSVA